MKERTYANAATPPRDEPWPTIETRWPHATWLSPWEFEADESEPDEPEPDPDEQDWDRLVRH